LGALGKTLGRDVVHEIRERGGERMITVLIVDDSPLVRERLVHMVSQFSGVEIAGQTGDPHVALEAIRSLPPSVVILDIRLPGLSGIEMLLEIKKLDPAPVVIMLTNYPYPQYREKCMKAGADFFLDKSTEFQRIGEILGEISSHEKDSIIQDLVRKRKP
jgi:DNA-binding NarL/FixJ family response regulator